MRQVSSEPHMLMDPIFKTEFALYFPWPYEIIKYISHNTITIKCVFVARMRRKCTFFFSTVGHIYMKDMQNVEYYSFFAYTLKLKPNLWDLHLIWISAKKSAIMVIRKDHELKARVIIFEYLNFIWCVKQQPYFSGKNWYLWQWKHIRLLEVIESHRILEQFLKENMDTKVFVLIINVMHIHSKNSCCVLTTYS